MKLLFVTGSLVHGGAERHTITLANRLAERGHECHAAYVKDERSQLPRLKGAQSVLCLGARRYLDRAALGALVALARRVQPSAVVAVNAYAMLYARLALARSGVRAPLAVTWHTTVVQGAKERLKMLYYRPIFWSADCLVFVCEAQRRYWRARHVWARRNEVIHNGIDAALWAPWGAEERRRLRGALGFADGDYVIGLSAVLRPEKNPLELVKAVAQLRRRGLPARALMIGDGPMRHAVEERARRLGIEASVSITGLQQEVRPFLGACDTVVLTSRSEALSLAAIEAMSLGKPVVHSDVGGAAEIIRPGRNGFLYPSGDLAALVERLARLAAPAARERMGAKARRTVEDEFTEAAMVDRYEQLLLQLETRRTQHENLRRTAGAH